MTVTALMQRFLKGRKRGLAGALAEFGLRYNMRTILRSAYRAGQIGTVYDIGAHKGRWSRHMQRLMPNARFVLFEANPQHRAELLATEMQHYIAVLGKG